MIPAGILQESQIPVIPAGIGSCVCEQESQIPVIFLQEYFLGLARPKSSRAKITF
jgi:hypothetical protein